MPRPKKLKAGAKAEPEKVLDAAFVLMYPKIAPLTNTYDRADLNELKEKINEIIKAFSGE